MVIVKCLKWKQLGHFWKDWNLPCVSASEPIPECSCLSRWEGGCCCLRPADARWHCAVRSHAGGQGQGPLQDPPDPVSASGSSLPLPLRCQLPRHRRHWTSSNYGATGLFLCAPITEVKIGFGYGKPVLSLLISLLDKKLGFETFFCPCVFSSCSLHFSQSLLLKSF